MEENQKYIPGIYNWCDRWCERCPQTDRCRVFEKEERRKSSNQDKEWPEVVSDNLNETLEMLKKMADEMGIDLDSEEVKEESAAQMALEEAQGVIAENHPLHELSEEYWKKGKDWLDSELLEENLLEWKSWVEMGRENSEAIESDLRSAEEALEVIQWYLFFIPVKIKRALHDQMDGFWDQYPDEERSDLGTAKIAAIAVDRSLEAWELLYKLFPKEELLAVLDLLKKMREGLIEVFPNYPKFIRPGFDD
jgi:hypothetical protein